MFVEDMPLFKLDHFTTRAYIKKASIKVVPQMQIFLRDDDIDLFAVCLFLIELD